MLQVRLASEAVGQVGILAQIFGEGLRVSALGTEIPMDNRISSVALDRAMFIVSGAMVSMVGIVAALLAISLTHAFRVYAVLFVIILFGLLLVVVLAMLNRWPFMSRSARVIGRLQFLRQRVENALPLIDSVENKLFDFHRWTPGAFWASLGLNLACQAMAVLEVYLVLWLMGIKIGLLGALVFESLTKLVNAVGSFNPGNIGTYEGGNMLIAKLFGVTGAVGLSVAVTRRLRAIFWAAVGVFCLFPLPRFKSNSKSDRSMSTSVAKSNKTGLGSQGATQAFTSVIFASAFGGLGEARSPLMLVGTLPILLRNILSATKGCWTPNDRMRGSYREARCAVRTGGHRASASFCRVARSTPGYADIAAV